MFTWGNDKSRTLVALPDAGPRKGIRKIMQGAGFLHCREIAELDRLEERLGAEETDLLITTLNERDWDCSEIIRRIRHGQLGNPFMLIMVLLGEASPVLVNKVVNAGADDLLLPPWLERLVLGRLDGLIHGRKPFLVTHDYVGPERRGSNRGGAAPAQAIEVPNPMHWLTVASGTREGLARVNAEVQEAVNLGKVKSCGSQLRFLADRVVANFASIGHAGILADIQVMLVASQELVVRAEDTHFAPAIELAVSLRTLCQRLAREDRPARSVEVGMLPTLADALNQAISNSEPEPISAALLPPATG